MTAQAYEKLIYKGTEYKLAATPLEDWIKSKRKPRRPKFARESTALYRGYIGTWEIIDEQLFLTSIEGWLWQGDDIVEATLKLLFPKIDGPVPATWVNGWLRCPDGAMRCYRHAGFASEFERDRHYVIENGLLKAELVVHNPPSQIVYHLLPDGSRRYLGAEVRYNQVDAQEDPFLPDEEVDPWKLWGDRDWDIGGKPRISGMYRLPRD